MVIKVKVDKDKCISCGACVAIAPEIFEFGEDGKSQTKMDIIEDNSLIEKAKEARDACPTGAIIVEEE